MKELFDKLEPFVVTHLWDIARECEEHGGFKCQSQLDDVKTCLSCVKKMHELKVITSR